MKKDNVEDRKMFVLRDLESGKELDVLQDLDGFISVLDLPRINGLREAVYHHKVKGDFRKWLESIDKRELSERLKLFEKRSMDTYAAAATIFYNSMENKKTDFSMVVGLDEAKEMLRERAVYSEKYKKLSEMYNKQSKGGILLYGPPGCGKTYLANALAGETSKILVKKKVSELIDGFFASVNLLFSILNTTGNCALFIDEMEMLATRRDESNHSRIITNSLLSELDSMKNNETFVFIGATNSPWLMDPAVIRSGRLDELIYIGVPDRDMRINLFRFFTKNIPLADSVNFDELAEKTDFYSCSDIEAICDAAVSIPWREAMEGKQRDVEQKDYDEALEIINSTTIPWFEEASQIMFTNSARKRFGPMIKEIERYKRKKQRVGSGDGFHNEGIR